MDQKQLRVNLVIAAPADTIFALLADPYRHATLDGSGTVQGPVGDATVLTAVGQVFGMTMKADDLGDYRVVNTVTAFVPDSRIGWGPSLDPSCSLAERLADITTGGHTFTYDLRTVEGGTDVTQTYDWSTVKDPQFEAFFPRVTEDELGRTLHNIARATT